ncbi:N-acetyl sugar amidotransferase [Nibrella saemangeumensis]|uniref:N-acetyl sugar amidotransferase n=1 Tax=Nibrella saemangeumensis TaxID=1084526 RepID=A0ABP8MZY0_9BACT
MSDYQICQEGIWDTSVPGIRFDAQGVSNYATIQKKLSASFPRGAEGKSAWEQTVARIRKQKPAGSRYDCLIGVSGGTDSSYLLHIAREYGLNPLAVNLDNGWNSDIAVKNIKKVTTALNIDLETYVIDYEEIKDILRSYMFAGLPWIDAPTDLAIKSILYKLADQENLKYVLIGSDFRSEGKQPSEWTYTDLRQLKHVHGQFGRVKLKTYPTMTLWDFLYLGYGKKIRLVAPFNHLPYQKKNAQAILQELYAWEYYGGHHHENLFTKFAVAYWLPRKFNIDKRRITLSAQVLSGEITREEALAMISQPPYATDRMEADKAYVIKKLDLSPAEFDAIWEGPNKTFLDYPSYYPLMKRMLRLSAPVLKQLFAVKPKIFYEMEERAA